MIAEVCKNDHFKQLIEVKKLKGLKLGFYFENRTFKARPKKQLETFILKSPQKQFKKNKKNHDILKH